MGLARQLTVVHMCGGSTGTRICLKRNFLSQKQALAAQIFAVDCGGLILVSTF